MTIAAALARDVEKGRARPGTRRRAARAHRERAARSPESARRVRRVRHRHRGGRRRPRREAGAVRRARAGRRARDCILATNTSSLSVAAIGAATTHAGRVVGMHFFNPAPVMPLVGDRAGDHDGARGRGAHARARDGVGEDDGRRDGHAGLHRQSRRAPVLRRGAAHPRGRASPTSPRSTGRCASSADFAWVRSS